jgi:hypothetical protein
LLVIENQAPRSRRHGVNTSAVSFDPTAIDVDVSEELLRVSLADGREVAAPLAWFPRLHDSTPEQRRHWRLIGRGAGIYWPDVDEDVSVRGLLGLPT